MAQPTRIVVLGGGFGGVAAVRHLERLCRGRLGAGPGVRSATKRISACWLRRRYDLMQMPRWDRRFRIVLDWTVALFFRPDITKVDLRVERDLVRKARQLVERSSG